LAAPLSAARALRVVALVAVLRATTATPGARAAAAASPKSCDADWLEAWFQDNKLKAPWYGAKPARETYAFRRDGFASCSLCGGSERLGAVVEGVDPGGNQTSRCIF